MKKLGGCLIGVTLALALGGLINFLDGLDGKPESPTPSPTIHREHSNNYDPDVEQHQQDRESCSNWYYC